MKQVFRFFSPFPVNGLTTFTTAATTCIIVMTHKGHSRSSRQSFIKRFIVSLYRGSAVLYRLQLLVENHDFFHRIHIEGSRYEI